MLFFLSSTFLLHGSWTPLNASTKVDKEVSQPGVAITFTTTPMVAIRTGPLTANSSIQANNVTSGHVANEVRFELTDSVAGKKTRLELTACFSTLEDLHRHGVVDPDEVEKISALAMVALNCSGAYASKLGAQVAASMNVSYDVKFPRTLAARNGNYIVGQFHGRPDARIFLDPATNTTVRLSTAAAYVACGGGGTRWGCKDGAVNVPGGAYDGWRYKQGGYPPLTFSLASHDGSPAVWAITARSDDRIFVPKADCGFNPGENGTWPDKRVCPGGVHESVQGVWRGPFNALPLGEWLRFTWRVTWSAYAKNGGSRLSDGRVSLRVTLCTDEDAKAEAIPLVDVVGWSGPLGRHDDGRSPYFKLGVYNPSGSPASIDIAYRAYSQSFREAGMEFHTVRRRSL